MKLVYKYLITVAVGLAAVLMIVVWKDVFAMTEAVRVFHILCDAFFAVGVVMTGVGLLIFTTNEGVFHGLTFAVTSFINMFRKDVKRKYDSYYDYKESHTRKLSFGFMLICGFLFLAISIIMYLLYLQHK